MAGMPENASLFAKYRQSGSIILRNRLIAQSLPLVRWVVGRYFQGWLRRGFDFDDLCGEGAFGLIKSIENHDPAKGAFSTYAIPMIKSYVRLYLKKETRRVKMFSLDAPLSLSGDEDTLGSTVADEQNEGGENVLVTLESKAQVKRVLKRMDWQSRYIVLSKLEGQNYNSTAQVLGVTRQRVEQLYTGAVNKIKAQMDTKIRQREYLRAV